MSLPFSAMVISLERTPERLSRFRKQFDPSLRDQVVLMPAIDGKNLDLESLLDSGDLSESALNWPKGQVGCALSHRACWQACQEKDEPLLIMEDDVVIPPDWECVVQNQIENIKSKDWDLLMLGWNFDSGLSAEWAPGQCFTALFRPRYNNYDELLKALSFQSTRSWLRLRMLFGPAAYFISPVGAKKLLKLTRPLMSTPIYNPELSNRVAYSLDGQLNSLYSELNAWVLFPPLMAGENNQQESLT